METVLLKTTFLAGMEGLEPPTYGLTVRRSDQLNYIPLLWARQDLNLRPPPYQSGVLTKLNYLPIKLSWFMV